MLYICTYLRKLTISVILSYFQIGCEIVYCKYLHFFVILITFACLRNNLQSLVYSLQLNTNDITKSYTRSIKISYSEWVEAHIAYKIDNE